ncbi:hypothetical protein B5M47_01195 [candidate division CPR3 bacterium 4484_211]|uniref:AMMECR1 domain-containing protein n=1 Tax=candidate division CPR3 bacterium 4484_211 TaxID=1968527 RepID=A0A1W9NYS8_UNCC3|nr:MAG: hypothetical protein B5M47_01195 [candidate division CPR3 bacterium 4484_211]
MKNLKELLKIARQTLEEYVKTGRIPRIEVQNEALRQPHGAFVTLRKNDKLRGCIGILESNQPLWQVIQQQTIAAAAQDPRFPPVSESELKDIKIEISVLSPLQKVNSWKEIELGKHGVVIEQGSRRGVFLPQVAKETGWDLKTFLGQLCFQKAGLPWNAYQNPQTNIYIFSTKTASESDSSQSY